MLIDLIAKIVILLIWILNDRCHCQSSTSKAHALTSPSPKRRILIGYLAATAALKTPKAKDPIAVPVNSTANVEIDSRLKRRRVELKCTDDLYATKPQELQARCIKMMHMNPFLQGHMVSGALRYAIELINKDPKILPNYTLDYEFIDTRGNPHRSVKAFMELWKKGVSVFIGPEENCQTEAMMAASQNIPIISFRCLDHTVSDKARFPTFVRTVPDDRKISRSVIALLKFYNWQRFGIVSGSTGPCRNLLEAIKEDANRENMQILNISSYDMPFSNAELGQVDQIKNILLQTLKTTRIYVMFGSVSAMQSMLMAMGEFNLFAKGEYVLIYVDPNFTYISADDASMNQFYRPTAISISEFHTMPEAKRIIELSRSLMVLIPTPVNFNRPDYNEFILKSLTYLTEPPFEFYKPKIVDKMLFQGKFNRYISYVYDAIRLYSGAVREVLDEGGSIDDGRYIISKLLNKSYPSMLGFTMTLDEHGDPQGNYTLLTRQKLKRSAFDLEHGMVQTAHFIQSKSYLPSMQLADKISISWSTPNGQPPPDMPPCGFFDELCYEEPNYGVEIVSGSLAALSLIGLIIGFIYYRNWKYEQELAGLIWKIEPKDIQFRPYNTLSMVNCGSKATVYSQESVEMGYNYFGFDPNAFAIYKGSVVAIKTVTYSRKVKDISRATKIEMKKMRELHHDNVNNFLGIMTEPSCVRVVREYCAKGSLFDVLLDDNLKLDQLFIASFIEDLLKGMIYIHDSELKVHGNLKSTNCVITSRWTLQVSDFALQELRDGQEYDSEESLFYSLLWTAPELLREDALHHPPKGTQKGDIYSFGIIFHEILSRNGPYDIYKDGHCISPKEIITNLCAESVFTFYRPNLADLELQGYMIEAMENCWEEVPQRRTDFRSVRQRLKLLFKGILKRNIMDHMITMMEKYQTHLEELVDERTEELKEEKKRTEILLHRMLPKSVASQLVKGEDVIPESYESVTVYFSDIVGFTSLSADSTPLEVVQFLNALYTLFDRIIHQYDVYKVETIGDAYMVVSGLPIRNGDKHAGEIATMALLLLEKVKEFQIPHRRDQPCLLRIGIHTGPCVAGVVGRTMPRYCLFGDTVNTASRMESNGLPLRIHISESVKNALEKLGGYKVEERGLVAVKGKGEMRTYWLLGKEDTIEMREGGQPAYEDFSHVFGTHQPLKSNLRTRAKGSIVDAPAIFNNSNCANATKPGSRESVKDRRSTVVNNPSFGETDKKSNFPLFLMQKQSTSIPPLLPRAASRLFTGGPSSNRFGIRRAETQRRNNYNNDRPLITLRTAAPGTTNISEAFPLLMRNTISDECDINVNNRTRKKSVFNAQGSNNFILPSRKTIENISSENVDSENGSAPRIRKRSLSYPENVQALAELIAAQKSCDENNQSIKVESNLSRQRRSLAGDDDSIPLLVDYAYDETLLANQNQEQHFIEMSSFTDKIVSQLASPSSTPPPSLSSKGNQSPAPARKRSLSCNDAPSVQPVESAMSYAASSTSHPPGAHHSRLLLAPVPPSLFINNNAKICETNIDSNNGDGDDIFDTESRSFRSTNQHHVAWPIGDVKTRVRLRSEGRIMSDDENCPPTDTLSHKNNALRKLFRYLSRSSSSSASSSKVSPDSASATPAVV